MPFTHKGNLSLEHAYVIEIGIWVLIVGFIFIRCYHYFFNNRHQRKIRQAAKILKRIRSFQGEHVNQKIFSYLRKIDCFVFEEMILTCFKEAGCKIIRNKRYTGDGGIDGRVIIDGALHLVQCKRYKQYINRRDVQIFDHKVTEYKAKKGFFVHTGKTGKASQEQHYTNVKMISGARLITLLRGSYPFKR